MKGPALPPPLNRRNNRKVYWPEWSNELNSIHGAGVDHIVVCIGVFQVNLECIGRSDGILVVIGKTCIDKIVTDSNVTLKGVTKDKEKKLYLYGLVYLPEVFSLLLRAKRIAIVTREGSTTPWSSLKAFGLAFVIQAKLGEWLFPYGRWLNHMRLPDISRNAPPLAANVRGSDSSSAADSATTKTLVL